MNEPQGLDNGLTNYGDRDFASYLRRSMAHSMGVSGELLSRPVIGIAASQAASTTVIATCRNWSRPGRALDVPPFLAL